MITPPRYDDTHNRPNRLLQVLAWVGIIAGVLFIVAAIFFTGVFFGRTTGGYHGWDRDYHGGRMGPDGPMDDCPMVRPGGMGPGGTMGPGQMGPGQMGPGGMGPGGMMGPGQPSPTMPPFTQRPS